MARSGLKFLAEMDDGTSHEVTVDQRDFAKWEAQPFADEALIHTRLRFLTFSAMKRAGLTSAQWPEFNERLLVDTGIQEDEEEAEDEQGLDPGRTRRTGTN
jgi:hypothetical protein